MVFISILIRFYSHPFVAIRSIKNLMGNMKPSKLVTVRYNKQRGSFECK